MDFCIMLHLWFTALTCSSANHKVRLIDILIELHVFPIKLLIHMGLQLEGGQGVDFNPADVGRDVEHTL